MDDSRFWSLVDETRAAASGNLERQAELLRERLAQLAPDEIVEFDRLWRTRTAQSYTWDLWAAAYVISGGCSDDCFDYFRDYLVSLGREVFEAALGDPDSLADVARSEEEAEWESISYVRDEAYESVASVELPFDASLVVTEPSGTAWDEDEVAERVPRLAAKWW